MDFLVPNAAGDIFFFFLFLCSVGSLSEELVLMRTSGSLFPAA